jgi:hypothetical protein
MLRLWQKFDDVVSERICKKSAEAVTAIGSTIVLISIFVRNENELYQARSIQSFRPRFRDSIWRLFRPLLGHDALSPRSGWFKRNFNGKQFPKLANSTALRGYVQSLNTVV